MAHIEEEPQTRAPDRKNPLEGQGKVGKKARRALLAVLAVLAVAGGYGVYLSEKRAAEGGISTPSPVTATAPEGTLPPLPSEGEIFPFEGVTIQAGVAWNWTPGGRNGMPSIARRKASSTLCPFLRAVEM